MSLDNIVIARTGLTNSIVIGKLNKNKTEFLEKKDAENMLFNTLVEYMFDGKVNCEEGRKIGKKMSWGKDLCFDVVVKKISKEEFDKDREKANEI